MQLAGQGQYVQFTLTAQANALDVSYALNQGASGNLSVYVNGAKLNQELSLTSREFSLLETFMRHPGEVLSRFELLEHVWDGSYENRSNVIEVYVAYLRDKLGRDAIETVRGTGYRLATDGDRL